MVVDALHREEHTLLLADGQDLAQAAKQCFLRFPAAALDEVVNIQREGAQKRKEAEVELGRIEGELKQKLMELRS